MPQSARSAIFLRAADLLAARYRPLLNAATMLGQSKTAHQAEIDSACETIDFYRFNVHFAERILAEQPTSSPGTWNRLDARPLEGFVFAVAPVNFTSIGANLPTAPAIPRQHRGLEARVDRGLRGALPHAALDRGGAAAGRHQPRLRLRRRGGRRGLRQPTPRRRSSSTGSTGVFRSMWKSVAQNLDRYRTVPRASSGRPGARTSSSSTRARTPIRSPSRIVRGAFEFQGQKCSAASRVYLPSTIAAAVRERVVAMMGELSVGDVRDFSTFMGAVIDRKAFREHVGYIEHARHDGSRILAGGTYDDKVGYFVQPTLVETPDPKSRLMREEIFGPVLTWYVYDANDVEGALALCDTTSPYALTGAVFARDRRFIEHAAEVLRHAAGNFYVNDKPTGAVVGQQPFGGARASGTNDKAGSLWNLVRWVSPRAIKENLAPPTSWRYPSMGSG